MKILAIETSCDETAAAIVENGQKIISNTVASSVALHQKTGGIIPEVAAREQVKYLIPVIKQTLGKNPEKTIKSLEALAVTIGPGLIGSLLIGVETAKTLAYVWNKPLIPINHLQAHLYANWLEGKTPIFPALGLVVSGGHTDLVLIKNHQKIKWLGGTRDDAAGECFDKCARLLNLGYPGGPAISQAANQLKENQKPEKILPRPMINTPDLDFSFSGLKTAVLTQYQKLQKNNRLNKLSIDQLAFEIQESIADVLTSKVDKASRQYQVKSVLLAGGVSANQRLSQKIKQTIKNVPVFIPSPKFCTDNAAYIASCAFFNFKPTDWRKVQANSSLEIEEMIK